MNTHKLLALMLAAAAALVVAGCRGGGPSSQVYVKNGTAQRLRLAVLPFDNVSRDQEAGRVLTNTVITYLLSTNRFDVVEPGVVNSALTAEGVRLTDGVSAETCKKLQPRLKADAYIIGMVEEYGEVRIGADTYPSISFSARLVDAQTAEILWASTISRTGDESVKIFDIGRVSSLGKLSKIAVAAMADSLAKSKLDVFGKLSALPPAPATTTNTTPAPTTVTSPPPAPTDAAKYLDEAPAYGEKELTGLLKDIGAAKLGEVSYSKHYHDTVVTRYQLDGKKFVEVKLVDYRKVDIAKKFLLTAHDGAKETTFATLPAFTGDSEYGYYHLDFTAGRFGLFLRGPKDRKADLETVANGLIVLLK